MENQYTYLEAITIGFPLVKVSCVGDEAVYTNIVWESGNAIPTQEVLDEWILANPKTEVNELEITKYQFRKLFTLTERVAIDNAPVNTAIPANYRAMLVTMNKDMELSSLVQLNNPDVAQGVMFLEQLGLIGVGRATRVLSNLPPV